MPFSYTSKNVHLRPDGKELYLCATCKTDNDDWVYSEIRLDDKLNVLPDDTVFIDDDVRVSYDTLELKSGSVLSGVVSDGTAFTFCLEFYFSNYNGRLEFDAPHDDVRGRMVKYTLNDDAVLRGLVVGKDGRLHYSELPLGDHYENKDGYLVPKKDGHFNWTARSFWIGSDWSLSAERQYWSLGGGYQIASYDIYKDIEVGMRGGLSITDPVEYGFFDPRGPFFRFLEDIPLLGYYIAGIDAMAGYEDEAKRAAAECTYSTMVLAASIAGGTLGGPLGAALGSAIATVAGKYVEAAIAETIQDPTMRAPLTGVSIYNILVSEVFIIAGVGIGEISSQFGQLLTDELTEEGFSDLFSKMAGQLGKKGLKKLTKEELKLIVDTVIKAVQEGHDSDWVAKQLGFQTVRPLSPIENPSGPPGHDPWKIGRI